MGPLTELLGLLRVELLLHFEEVGERELLKFALGGMKLVERARDAGRVRIVGSNRSREGLLALRNLLEQGRLPCREPLLGGLECFVLGGRQLEVLMHPLVKIGPRIGLRAKPMHHDEARPGGKRHCGERPKKKSGRALHRETMGSSVEKTAGGCASDDPWKKAAIMAAEATEAMAVMLIPTPVTIIGVR